MSLYRAAGCFLLHETLPPPPRANRRPFAGFRSLVRPFLAGGRSFLLLSFFPFLPSFFLLRPRLSAPSQISTVLSPPRPPPPPFFSSSFFPPCFLSLCYFEDFRISRSSFVILFAEVNCTVRSIVWRVLVRRHRWVGRGLCGSVKPSCLCSSSTPLPGISYGHSFWSLWT